MQKIQWIQSKIDENDIVLDVGCGNDSLLKCIKCKKMILLDAWPKANPDILLDLEEKDLTSVFEENSIDVILMMDLIEHLDKDRGYEILKQAKIIARKRILILTPLWWSDNSENVDDPNSEFHDNKYNYHKSLWTLEDFKGWQRVNLEYHKNYFTGSYEKE